MAVCALHRGMDCRRCTLQKYYGCEHNLPSPVDVMGYRVTRCARKLARPIDFVYVPLYGEWKKGVLPNPGGWLDQPMKYAAVMNALDGIMDKVEKE